MLFDLLTGPDVGVAPNVANCAIETLATRVSDDELIALGAATAEPAAVVPITAAALDCGITQNEIDRAIAIQRGEEPPPVEDAPAETASATTEPAGPLVDPSTFGTDRPASLVGGILFDLLTRDEVGVAPNVANCAIETLASRVSDDELIALGGATAEPAAVVPITQAALDCGIDQESIDIAVAIQRGVVEFGFAELATASPPATQSLQPFSPGAARTRFRSAQLTSVWLVAFNTARAWFSLVDCS